MTELGRASDYLHNDGIRNQCRQLMALSLMPMNEVENQFQRLQSTLSESLRDLVAYFEHQWLNGVVPLHMWNFHNVFHRTNNTSESKTTFRRLCFYII